MRFQPWWLFPAHINTSNSVQYVINGFLLLSFPFFFFQELIWSMYESESSDPPSKLILLLASRLLAHPLDEPSVQFTDQALVFSLISTMVNQLLFKPWFADWLSNLFLETGLCPELCALNSGPDSQPRPLQFPPPQLDSAPCQGVCKSLQAMICR